MCDERRSASALFQRRATSVDADESRLTPGVTGKGGADHIAVFAWFSVAVSRFHKSLRAPTGASSSPRLILSRL